MLAGSLTEWLSKFESGERQYLETSILKYRQDMSRLNVPKSRRPDWMKDRVFTTQFFTAVPARGIEEPIRYIICVERVK